MHSDTETKEGREKEKSIEVVGREAGRAHAEGPQRVQRSSRKYHLLRARREINWWNLGRKHEMATIRNQVESQQKLSKGMVES